MKYLMKFTFIALAGVLVTGCASSSSSEVASTDTSSSTTRSTAADTAETNKKLDQMFEKSMRK